MNIIDVNKAIMKMNNDEINAVISTIKSRRNALTRQMGDNFVVGMKIHFGRPNGIKRSGVVKKMGPSKALIDCGGFMYRVPYSMMTKVKEAK